MKVAHQLVINNNSVGKKLTKKNNYSTLPQKFFFKKMATLCDAAKWRTERLM